MAIHKDSVIICWRRGSQGTNSFWKFVLYSWVIITLFNLKSLKALQPISSSYILADTRCQLVLSIGRVEGTAMPPEWAASGARLVLPDLEVEFQKTKPKGGTDEWLIGPVSEKRLVVNPLTQPTFVSVDGQQTVPVEAGAYCIAQLEGPKSNLRFYLDFPEGAVRNDVVLPAERVFFTLACWMDDDILSDMIEERRVDQLELEKLKDQLANLDEGDGFFQKAFQFRSKVDLVERIGVLRARREGQDQYLPDKENKDILSFPPSMLFAEEGYMTVKRYGGIMNKREEYHIVGTFRIKKFIRPDNSDEDV